MNKEVKIQSADGKGTFSAFMSCPETDAPVPAVIVIQEIFGVNKVMRDICGNVAQAGYLAICPDMFWRQEPNVRLTDKSEAEWERALQLYQGFDIGKGIEDLKATLAFMRRSKDCSGKVGTIGYCLGGKLAYLMATRTGADCNVSYYGVGIEDMVGEAGTISKPLLMHMAEKDKFVPPPAQAKIIQALRTNKHAEIHVYPAVNHAFARVGGEHYNKAAANLANGRTAGFLAKHLSIGS